MNHRRDARQGVLNRTVAMRWGLVACAAGVAVVGIRPAAASLPSTPVPSAAADVAARVAVDWQDVRRADSGEAIVPLVGGLDVLPAGAAVSTSIVREDGGAVRGVMFDPDRSRLSVDAGTAPGRYGVTLHVVRGGVEIGRGYDEFEVR